MPAIMIILQLLLIIIEMITNFISTEENILRKLPVVCDNRWLYLSGYDQIIE